MKEAIRLTNKTAIALRKSAQKTRTAYFAAAVMMSITLGAAGIARFFQSCFKQARSEEGVWGFGFAELGQE